MSRTRWLVVATIVGLTGAAAGFLFAQGSPSRPHWAAESGSYTPITLPPDPDSDQIHADYLGSIEWLGDHIKEEYQADCFNSSMIIGVAQANGWLPARISDISYELYQYWVAYRPDEYLDACELAIADLTG